MVSTVMVDTDDAIATNLDDARCCPDDLSSAEGQMGEGAFPELLLTFFVHCAPGLFRFALALCYTGKQS